MIEDAFLLFRSGDVCTLTFAALVLALVGRAATCRRHDLKALAAGLALAGFIAWMALSVTLDSVADPSILLGNIVRAAVCGGLVWGTATVLLPALDCLAEHTWRRPTTRGSQWWRAIARARESRAEGRRREVHALEAAREYEESAPQREREQERLRRDREDRERDAIQRDDVRLEVQLLYDRHRQDLLQRLPPEQFQTYFERFLTDDIAPERFVRRAEQLKAMIADGVASAGRPPRTFTTFDEVISHFADEQRGLEHMELDDDMRETLLFHLDEARDRALRELMQ